MDKSKIIVGLLNIVSKYKFKPNKRNIPGYLFTPLQSKYPNFIVHTKIRKECNQLITIKYLDWKNKQSLPKGQMVRLLGNHNEITSMEYGLLYNYELYPKSSNWKLNGAIVFM